MLRKGANELIIRADAKNKEDDIEVGRIQLIVGDAAPEDLDALLLQRIARFKRPKRYAFVDELPKNSYGKVLKRRLREQLG